MAFDLSSITRGKRLRAPKVVIYGPPKVGKSTFAAGAPNPIGVITEEGLDNIDVAAFPKATSLADVDSALTTLATEKHDYQTVFVDSLDWLEPLILAQVCKEQKVKNIEDIGYGKGYIMADDLWRAFFAKLDYLRDQRSMSVICIAHEQITKVKNPTLADDYDAYSLKLNKRAVGVITEWADVIGFAQHEVMTRATDAGFNQKDIKAVSTGARKLHLNPHPAYIAGNRYGIPDVPLSWSAFEQALAAAMSS
jgi:AAA domain